MSLSRDLARLSAFARKFRTKILFKVPLTEEEKQFFTGENRRAIISQLDPIAISSLPHTQLFTRAEMADIFVVVMDVISQRIEAQDYEVDHKDIVLFEAIVDLPGMREKLKHSSAFLSALYQFAYHKDRVALSLAPYFYGDQPIFSAIDAVGLLEHYGDERGFNESCKHTKNFFLNLTPPELFVKCLSHPRRLNLAASLGITYADIQNKIGDDQELMNTFIEELWANYNAKIAGEHDSDEVLAEMLINLDDCQEFRYSITMNRYCIAEVWDYAIDNRNYALRLLFSNLIQMDENDEGEEFAVFKDDQLFKILDAHKDDEVVAQVIDYCKGKLSSGASLKVRDVQILIYLSGLNVMAAFILDGNIIRDAIYHAAMNNKSVAALLLESRLLADGFSAHTTWCLLSVSNVVDIINEHLDEDDFTTGDLLLSIEDLLLEPQFLSEAKNDSCMHTILVAIAKRDIQFAEQLIDFMVDYNVNILNKYDHMRIFIGYQINRGFIKKYFLERFKIDYLTSSAVTSEPVDIDLVRSCDALLHAPYLLSVYMEEGGSFELLRNIVSRCDIYAGRLVGAYAVIIKYLQEWASREGQGFSRRDIALVLSMRHLPEFVAMFDEDIKREIHIACIADQDVAGAFLAMCNAEGQHPFLSSVQVADIIHYQSAKPIPKRSSQGHIGHQLNKALPVHPKLQQVRLYEDNLPLTTRQIRAALLIFAAHPNLQRLSSSRFGHPIVRGKTVDNEEIIFVLWYGDKELHQKAFQDQYGGALGAGTFGKVKLAAIISADKPDAKVKLFGKWIAAKIVCLNKISARKPEAEREEYVRRVISLTQNEFNILVKLHDVIGYVERRHYKEDGSFARQDMILQVLHPGVKLGHLMNNHAHLKASDWFKIAKLILVDYLKIRAIDYVHTDLSTNNILVDLSQYPRIAVHIIDFGLALSKGMHGAGIGTLEYSSHKLLKSWVNRETIQYDESIDLGSLSIVFGKMLHLTHTSPFKADEILNYEKYKNRTKYTLYTEDEAKRCVSSRVPVEQIRIEAVRRLQQLDAPGITVEKAISMMDELERACLACETVRRPVSLSTSPHRFDLSAKGPLQKVEKENFLAAGNTTVTDSPRVGKAVLN